MPRSRSALSHDRAATCVACLTFGGADIITFRERIGEPAGGVRGATACEDSYALIAVTPLLLILLPLSGIAQKSPSAKPFKTV